MAQRRAADFRVTINGIFYAVQSIGVSGNVMDIVTSNTEGRLGNPALADLVTVGAVSRIPDLADGEFSLTSATFDDADNPWASPIGLVLGGYYALGAFPAGIGSPAGYSWFNAMLTSFSHTGRIPGPQPLDLRFKPDGVDVLTMLGV